MPKWIDAILTSKYNKPFPVTLIPSAIGYYLYLKGHERQVQVLEQIAALGHDDLAKVDRISKRPE